MSNPNYLPGQVNPFEVTEDPTSLEAAQYVLAILTHPRFLAAQLGVTVSVIDTIEGTASLAPPASRYRIQIEPVEPGFDPMKVPEIVELFNTTGPENLRVVLNQQYGCGILGPTPLPCRVSYPSAYVFDPLATDPGPIPGWARKRDAAILAAEQAAKKKAPSTQPSPAADREAALNESLASDKGRNR